MVYLNKFVKSKSSIITLSGIILIVLLFSLRSIPEQQSAISRLRDKSFEKLNTQDQLEISKIESINSIESLEQLSKKWLAEDNPLMAAYEAFKLSHKTGKTNDWLNSGKIALESVAYIQISGNEQSLRNYFLDLASKSYDAVLSQDSENTEAMIGIASCIVKGGGPPMKGIQILLSIVAQDSANIDVLLQLGEFAIQSGQLDKAVERLQSVLEIDPKNPVALVYMGKALKALGKTEQAQSYMKQALALETRAYRRNEILNYLD